VTAELPWAVFIDRDGVLVDAPVVGGVAMSPMRVEDMVLLDGAADAVVALKAAGARTFVVTNQPDIARGRLSVRDLQVMHERLQADLGVDEIVVCPHDGAAACRCRKPLPGMLEDLATRWHIALCASYMVGDRWVDIAAGAAAGTTTLLVERAYSWNRTSSGEPSDELRPDFCVTHFLMAVAVILGHRSLSQGDKC
jgi:D-glycero-D-manno-heptose 1,7-bisphosphate phosphatase